MIALGYHIIHFKCGIFYAVDGHIFIMSLLHISQTVFFCIPNWHLAPTIKFPIFGCTPLLTDAHEQTVIFYFLLHWCDSVSCTFSWMANSLLSTTELKFKVSIYRSLFFNSCEVPPTFMHYCYSQKSHRIWGSLQQHSRELHYEY